MRFAGVMLVAAAVLAFACVAPAARADHSTSVVRCESQNYHDNYCPANTHGGVVLLRQRSATPCRQGESWGFDRRGIWVTAGCDGEFQLGGGSSAGYGNERYGGGNRGGGYGSDRDYGSGGQSSGYGGGRYGEGAGSAYRGDGVLVVCESRDYRYAHCPAAVRGSVELITQRSSSPCRYKRNWGYDRSGVWVDQGCGAEFAVH